MDKGGKRGAPGPTSGAHTATDGGATARLHDLELLAGRPPRTAGLRVL